MRPPGTEHPPRAILVAHEVEHLDHLFRRSRQLAELLLQLAKMVPPASFSTGLALSWSMACARKAHKVEDTGWDETCSGASQAAMLTTLVTLRPLLGVSYPWYQISFLALGRCSTSASCSSLVEEVRPASSARGRGCRWTGQPRLSNRDVGASTGRAGRRFFGIPRK